MSTKPIIFVTGANQGIGWYAAQQLASTGKYHVLIGSRDLIKGQKAIEDLVADKSVPVDKANLDVVQLDLADDDSIQAAADTVAKKYGHLDILVNNAGISGADNPNQSRRSAFQYIYNTNVFGTSLCTDAFIPLLRKSTAPGGKRIIFMSSGLGSLALATQPNPEYPAKYFPEYRSSKSAENAMAVHYGSLLGDEGFCIVTTCPGYCSTNLNGHSGPKPAAEGASVVEVAVAAKAEDVHMQFVNNENGMGTYPW